MNLYPAGAVLPVAKDGPLTHVVECATDPYHPNTRYVAICGVRFDAWLRAIGAAPTCPWCAERLKARRAREAALLPVSA